MTAAQGRPLKDARSRIMATTTAEEITRPSTNRGVDTTVKLYFFLFARALICEKMSKAIVITPMSNVKKW